MADNFVEGSFQIDLLNDEEVTWWKNQELDICTEDNEDEHSSDWVIERGIRLPGEPERRQVELPKVSIWFHGDPNLNIEAAVNTCQRFLKECRPKGSIGFCWAETCSKPRIDEFGGGSVFVTAHNTEWNSSYDWLQKKQTEFDDKGKPFPRIDLSFQGWCRGVELTECYDKDAVLIPLAGVTSDELANKITQGVWSIALSECLGQSTREEIEISDVESSSR